MKYKEIFEMGLKELALLEGKLRGELTDFRLQARSGQLAQTSKVGRHRRDIARILTARNKKERPPKAGPPPAEAEKVK